MSSQYQERIDELRYKLAKLGVEQADWTREHGRLNMSVAIDIAASKEKLAVLEQLEAKRQSYYHSMGVGNYECPK
jgi:hypothetical protein